MYKLLTNDDRMLPQTPSKVFSGCFKTFLGYTPIMHDFDVSEHTLQYSQDRANKAITLMDII